MRSGIYCIRNIVNNKIYIGSTVDFDKRWQDHKRKALGSYHKNKHLQSAILKYGIDNFNFEILEFVSTDKLFEREQFYLDTFKPFDKVGYNKAIKSGGGLLVDRSVFIGKNNPMFGKSAKDIVIKKYGEAKWSEMNRARQTNCRGKNNKPILQLTMDGDFIKEFHSITEAADHIGIHLSGIQQVCTGRKNSAGKYKWKYKN